MPALCLYIPMRTTNAPDAFSNKVEKLRLKNIVLILARSPASIKSTYCTGRSSDLFRLSRLPSFHQWQRERQTNFRNPRNGTHSNRHCSGFTPDSLFTFRDARSLKAPCAMTKIEKFFLGCTLSRKIFRCAIDNIVYNTLYSKFAG